MTTDSVLLTAQRPGRSSSFSDPTKTCPEGDTGLAVGHFAATDHSVWEQIHGADVQTVADSHMPDAQSDEEEEEDGGMPASQNKMSARTRDVTLATGPREENKDKSTKEEKGSNNKRSTSDSTKGPVCESRRGYDVPDGRRSADVLLAVCEALPEPVPLLPDPKKKQKLFKRNKKKSNEGNKGNGHTKHKKGCVLQ